MQRAHTLHSAVSSGRKAESGSCDIGVMSQKFPNHLQGIELWDISEEIEVSRVGTPLLLHSDRWSQSSFLLITEVSLALGLFNWSAHLAGRKRLGASALRPYAESSGRREDQMKISESECAGNVETLRLESQAFFWQSNELHGHDW